MVIGLLQLELYLNETNSLKQKRSVLSHLKTQIQKKFNVSFSETGMHEKWGRAEIAMTTASMDSKLVNQMFSAIEKQVEMFPAVRITHRHMEIL